MNKPQHIKGFDSLRAVSIMLVLLTHLGIFAFFENSPFLKYRVLPLVSGLTGVQIFFTISGFLITNLLLLEKLTKGFISIRNFYIRRFIRLLPALLIFYFILIITMYFGWLPVNKIGLCFSFFYLYNFIPHLFYSGELAHMWSLAVEEQFYLFWPLVIIAFKSFKSFSLIVLFILFCCIIGIYLLPVAVVIYKKNTIILSRSFFTMRWFIPAVAPIMIGCWAAIILNFKNRNLDFLVKNRNVALMISFILFVSTLFLPKIFIPYHSIFQSLGIALLLLLIYLNQESIGVRILNNKAMSYIGKISYGIYVYQGFFLKTGPSGTLPVQLFPFNILLTLLVAFISYELVEKKCLKLKKYFYAI